MDKKIILLFFIVATTVAHAQELNVNVTINADQIQTSDRTIFKSMEKAFASFLNVRKWTNDSYQNKEKIKVTFFLNITAMPSIGRFIANVQITSARPVYNSTYETIPLNFVDRKWEFEYIESLPLEYNDNAYTSNLTSLLAFYAYIILGMDYDSFSEMGGNPYFQKALNVVSNAEPSGYPGWQALASTRNRYALVSNLNNPQMISIRKNTYRYHRLAMDTFEDDPDKSRQIILEGLQAIKEVWTLYPSSIFIISFFDAKSLEITNVFSKGSLAVRRQAYELLSLIDPKRDTYNTIISN